MCRKRRARALHPATWWPPRSPTRRRAPRCVDPRRRPPPSVPAAARSATAPVDPVSVQKTRSKNDGSEKFGRELFGRGRRRKGTGWAPTLNPYRKHARQRLSTSPGIRRRGTYGGRAVFQNDNPLTARAIGTHTPKTPVSRRINYI